MSKTGKLTLLCGKMGAGKSTKAKSIYEAQTSVLIAEDDWLSQLYPDEINSFDDYIKYSNRIKPLIKLHVKDLLSTGANVVMDFPANTKKQREWFNSIATELDIVAELIFLKVSNETCLAQIAKRRTENPTRAKFDTPEVFAVVNAHFEEPSINEHSNLQVKIETPI